MSSIFTRIINSELPAYRVYEDEHVVAFLDINPIQPGHTLVVPKKEVDQLFLLGEDDYMKLMERVRYVAQILQAKLSCTRVCVIVEGYNVPHAHVHLIPTNSPDDLDKNLAHKASEEELKEMQTRIGGEECYEAPCG